jgi:hypothetical protein
VGPGERFFIEYIGLRSTSEADDGQRGHTRAAAKIGSLDLPQENAVACVRYSIAARLARVFYILILHDSFQSNIVKYWPTPLCGLTPVRAGRAIDQSAGPAFSLRKVIEMRRGPSRLSFAMAWR